MSHAHSCTETGSTQAQTSNNPQDIAAFKKQQRRQRKAALKPGDEFPLGPNLFAEFSLVPLALDRSNILAPRETKVWAYIYRWLRTTGEAFPGYDRIAQNVGVSRRQTIRLVKSLERKAFLRSSPRCFSPPQQLFSTLYLGLYTQAHLSQTSKTESSPIALHYMQ